MSFGPWPARLQCAPLMNALKSQGNGLQDVKHTKGSDVQSSVTKSNVGLVVSEHQSAGRSDPARKMQQR